MRYGTQIVVGLALAAAVPTRAQEAPAGPIDEGTLLSVEGEILAFEALRADFVRRGQVQHLLCVDARLALMARELRNARQFATSDPEKAQAALAAQSKMAVDTRSCLEGAGLASGITVTDVQSAPEAANRRKHRGAIPGGAVDAAVVTTAPIELSPDRASYAEARAELAAGRLPLPANVDLRGFINAVPYAYKAGTSAVEANIDAAPSPWADGKHLVRVGVQATRVPLDVRPPVNVAFLVDVSGSMRRTDKIDAAVRALRLAVDRLAPDDLVSIHTFGGTVDVSLEPTLARERATVMEAIDRIKADGTGGSREAFAAAVRGAQASVLPGATNRVIVLSDGGESLGGEDRRAVVRWATQSATAGIPVSTLGFGPGGQDAFMLEEIAKAGGGHYHFVDSLTEAERLIDRVLYRPPAVVADGVLVDVTFNAEAVTTWRQLGVDGGPIVGKPRLPEPARLESGESVTALYEVTLRESAPSEAWIAEVRLQWRGGDGREQDRRVRFDRSEIAGALPGGQPDLAVAAGAAAFAALLQGSGDLGGFSWPQARMLVASANRKQWVEDKELLQLIDRAAALDATSADLGD